VTVVTESVASLVSNVLTETAFDVPEPQALGWLSRAQRKMCARTGAYRKRITLATTVAEKGSYAVPPEVSEILQVDVEGTLYGFVRRYDASVQAPVFIWEGATMGWHGAGRDDDEEGNPELMLYPVPSEGGSLIEIWAVCVPPALSSTDDTTLKIPPDFYDALVSGAIATGYLRVEGRADLAAPHASIFNEACTELRKQVNRRFRGAGPTFIRLQGQGPPLIAGGIW